jgi:hypothetical protein
MYPRRWHESSLRLLIVVYVFVALALSGGCGSQGAGTVHIDSPRAQKKLMQTGAGLGTAAVANSGPRAAAGEPRDRSKVTNQR